MRGSNARTSTVREAKRHVPYADIANEPSVPNPHGSKYPDFLINEVMPAISQRFRIKTGSENTAIGGSSYGGLAALYTVIHRPGIFGRLLLESTPTFVADSKIMREAESFRKWPARVYIGIGTKETSNEELNKNAVPSMQKLLTLITKRSPRTRQKLLIGEGDSHSANAWRRRLPFGVEFLFSSPD